MNGGGGVTGVGAGGAPGSGGGNGGGAGDRAGNGPSDAHDASPPDSSDAAVGGRPDAIVDATAEARPRDLRPAAPIRDCPMPPEPPAGQAVQCPADVTELNRWLPNTPPVDSCRPPPHPATECRFYQFSWQHFLIATTPDATGRPAFLGWDSLSQVFGAAPRRLAAGELPLLEGGVTQAGGRQVLIDQKGHAIYYGMHMNAGFVNFVKQNGLTNSAGVRAADPSLSFPPDVVELKEAWQVVPDTTPPTDFITARVRVPTLAVDPTTHQITEDDTHPRDVTVALLAIHVVFTLPGHPEFIWSTFEHVDARGISDVAPNAPANPEATAETVVPSMLTHALFKGGTTAAEANGGSLTPLLNPATQLFLSSPTSIYRMYTASKSNQTDFDDDVVAMNENMTALFGRVKLPVTDRRGHYRLVGAIWQDRPDLSFETNRILVNDDNDPDIKKNGGDSPRSITGGEDRLSSTAMESFTQPATSFPNCFSCHDTRAATARGVPAARDQGSAVTLEPKQINVSHIFNEVVRRGL